MILGGLFFGAVSSRSGGVETEDRRPVRTIKVYTQYSSLAQAA